MATTALHFRNIRLRNNAGMDLPECVATAELLDVENREPTTGDTDKVSCLACKRSILQDPWHLTTEQLTRWTRETTTTE